MYFYNVIHNIKRRCRLYLAFESCIFACFLLASIICRATDSGWNDLELGFLAAFSSIGLVHGVILFFTSKCPGKFPRVFLFLFVCSGFGFVGLVSVCLLFFVGNLGSLSCNDWHGVICNEFKLNMGISIFVSILIIERVYMLFQFWKMDHMLSLALRPHLDDGEILSQTTPSSVLPVTSNTLTKSHQAPFASSKSRGFELVLNQKIDTVAQTIKDLTNEAFPSQMEYNIYEKCIYMFNSNPKEGIQYLSDNYKEVTRICLSSGSNLDFTHHHNVVDYPSKTPEHNLYSSGEYDNVGDSTSFQSCGELNSSRSGETTLPVSDCETPDDIIIELNVSDFGVDSPSKLKYAQPMEDDVAGLICLFLEDKRICSQKRVELLSGESPLSQRLLKLWVSSMNFHGFEIDVALRNFLAESVLPLETEKIDRLIQAFGHEYCTQNPSLFLNRDAAYILAFSILMLHTDAHSAALRSHSKMTPDQFVITLRGMEELSDVPTGFLKDIYNRTIKDRIIPGVKKRGWLLKRARPGRGGSHEWKRRFFILTSQNILYYCKHPKEPVAKLSIRLEGVDVVDANTSKPYAFVVRHQREATSVGHANERKEGSIKAVSKCAFFLLVASTEEQKLSWMAVIKDSCKNSQTVHRHIEEV